MGRNSTGYSLIELVIVILIASILSAGIFIYIGFSRTINLDSAASKAASSIRYAQSMAMSTTQWYGVSFEVSPADVYSVYTTNGTADSIIGDPASFGKTYTIYLAADFGSNIGSVSIGGGGRVEFSPMGQPYNDKLGLPLTAEGVIILTSGNNSKTLTITPNTGKVSIQ